MHEAAYGMTSWLMLTVFAPSVRFPSNQQVLVLLGSQPQPVSSRCIEVGAFSQNKSIAVNYSAKEKIARFGSLELIAEQIIPFEIASVTQLELEAAQQVEIR